MTKPTEWILEELSENIEHKISLIPSDDEYEKGLIDGFKDVLKEIDKIEDGVSSNKDDYLSKESIHMLKNMPLEGLKKELPELIQSPYKAFMYPDIKPSIPFIGEHLELNNTLENAYAREDSIIHHAQEIQDLHTLLQNCTDEVERNKLQEVYRNQCVDLMLVLISEYDSDPERINARLQKFKEKGALDEESKKEI